MIATLALSAGARYRRCRDVPALDALASVRPDVACALVPYDAAGRRLPPDAAAPRMWLDLSDGQHVRLVDHERRANARVAHAPGDWV